MSETAILAKKLKSVRITIVALTKTTKIVIKKTTEKNRRTFRVATIVSLQ